MLAKINQALVALSLLSVVACSQAPSAKEHKLTISARNLKAAVNNGTAAATANNNAAAAPSCDDIWTAYVASEPAGFVKAYKASTTTSYSGGEGLPADETVIETSTETVVTSTADAVTISYDYTASNATAATPTDTETVKKADFLAQCNAPAAANTPAANAPANDAPAQPDPTVTITAQGDEDKTVGAGAFRVDFVKGTIVQTGDNAYTADAEEWYAQGTDVLVASSYVSKSVFDTTTVTTTQIVELTKWEKGPVELAKATGKPAVTAAPEAPAAGSAH